MLDKTQLSQTRKKRRGIYVLVAASLLVLVALALGLGLGLGLRSRMADGTGGNISPLSSIDTSQQILHQWDVNAPLQTREYNFTVSQKRSAPGGLEKEMIVVNGISPGPLIEANLGDKIVVHVFNELNVTTTIHWHGQYQRGTNRMDGTFGVTQCGIPPKQNYTYQWTVQNTGTYWWHAHDGMQYSDGLYGPLILHGPNDPKYDVQGQNIIMASDLYNEPASSYLAEYESPQGPPGGMQGDEPVPDCGVVNGLGICAGGERNAVRTNLTGFEAGKQYRFRLINAGSLAMIRFELEGHKMVVIEADGTPVEPITVSSVTLKVAQRYSVLITMDQAPNAYRFRADLTKDMFMYAKESLVTEQSAILFYQGVPSFTPPANISGSFNMNSTSGMSDSGMANASSDSTGSMDSMNSMDSMSSMDSMNNGTNTMGNLTFEALLKPLNAIKPPAATKQVSLTVTKGRSSDNQLRFFFNETSWTPATDEALLYEVLNNRSGSMTPEEGLLLTNTEPIVMDLILINMDKDEHPMHLHGFDSFILGSGNGPFEYGKTLDLNQEFANPMRRDVFTLPGNGWSVTRMVLDNPGIWNFHCHIAWHMEVGFVTQLNVLPAQLALQEVDNYAKSFCAAS